LIFLVFFTIVEFDSLLQKLNEDQSYRVETHQVCNHFYLLLVIHLFCTDFHLNLEVEHLLMEVIWQHARLKNVKAVEACLHRRAVLAQLRIFLFGEVLAVLALLLRC
jgi:hypothetical protein